MLSGPEPVAFTDATSPVTKVLFSTPGTYVFQLAASDGSMTVVDRATITVDPEPSLTDASLVVALETPGPLTTGTAAVVTATLLNASAAPIGNFPVKLTIGGVNPAVAVALTSPAGVATFSYVGRRCPGRTSSTRRRSRPRSSSTRRIVPLQWNDPPNGGPVLTQGWIASPRTSRR